MDHLYNSSWMRPRHQDRLIFEEPDGDLIDCQLIASSASSSQLNREVPFERQRLPFNGDESNAMMRAFNANKKLKTGVEIGSYMPTAAQSSNGVLAMTSPPNIRIDLTSNTWDPFPFEARPTDKERQERIAAILEFLKLAASNPLLRTDDDGVSGGGVGHAQSPNTSVLHSGTGLNGHGGSLLHSTAHRKRSIDEATLSVTSNDTMQGEGEVNGDTATRFRACQEERWEESFQELVIFKEEFGHCRVPHNYEKNLALARWVKRQRNQYRRLSEGLSSTLIESRLKALLVLGFVWHSHTAVWEDHFCELKSFCSIHGHCNVPSTYSINPQLSTWVKAQRRQYKLMVANKKSTLNQERVEMLNKIGFQWNVEGHKRIHHPSATRMIPSNFDSY